MLQIISGKFFKSKNVISHAAKGVLYSNFSYIASIETEIATLESIDTYGDIATYAMSYTNQIEKVDPPQKDIIVRVGDPEIVNSFANLCSFYFMALFHIDKNHVVNSCRESRANYCDSYLPSKFFPNFFAKQVHGTAEQVAAFSVFVNKTLGFSRKNYESVMSSIRIFIESLSLVSGNIDLSYSSLVYALESLAQGYSPYSPCWDDFPKKDKIDKVLADIDASTAFELRNILIQDANLKAQKRFLDFTCQHIDDSFFIEYSPEGYGALKKSELVTALKNAYTLRSKYVHALQSIPKQLTTPHIATQDTQRIEGVTYLTFSGLSRLVKYVLMKFINRQAKITAEEYDWRSSLPGTMKMELAPQYWLWRAEGFLPKHACKKLNGFLSHFIDVQLKNKPFIDLSDLIAKFEICFEQANRNQKKQMLTLYCLYNGFLMKKLRSENYVKYASKYEKLIDECSIETMLLHMIYTNQLPWSTSECVSCMEGYLKSYLKPNKFRMPQLLAVALCCTVAGKFFESEEKK